MIVATAGHIDHGKTALVRALTGVDADRLPEEKARGLTIDLGFAYAPIDGGPVLGFVDVPGHERFVHNMLAGAAGVDFALLVVAADDGPMPQTREHLAILDLLGVDAGAVALTKVDRVDPVRVEAARAEVAALLAPTGLAGADVFEVSSVTGQGIDSLRRALAAAARGHRSRWRPGRFRLAVDRAFTVAGAGLVVTGTAVAGEVQLGDRLVLSPAGTEVRVRGIHAQNAKSERGAAGERLGLNIAGPGLDAAAVARGDWLLDSAAHAPTTRLDVRLALLPGEARPLASRSSVHLHLGAADVLAHVAVLDGPRIAPGDSGLVQLVAERPIAALRGDRLILRDRSARRTLGGGEVLDPWPPARRRARPERLTRLAGMAEPTPEAALRALLALPDGTVDLDWFARAWNLDNEAAATLAATVPAIRAGDGAAPLLIAEPRWAALRQELMARLDEWHARAPDSSGPGEAQLRRQHFRNLPPAAFRGLVEDAVRRGEVTVAAAHLARPGHRPVMTAADAALWRRVEPLLAAGGLRPPRVRELAAELDLPPDDMAWHLATAARFGLVHPVAPNRYFPPPAVRELAAIAEALAEQAGAAGFDAARFRDASGIGRNLTIEVLEYFDNVGFTRRRGEARLVVRPAAEAFGADDRREAAAT